LSKNPENFIKKPSVEVGKISHFICDPIAQIMRCEFPMDGVDTDTPSQCDQALINPHDKFQHAAYVLTKFTQMTKQLTAA